MLKIIIFMNIVNINNSESTSSISVFSRLFSKGFAAFLKILGASELFQTTRVLVNVVICFKV